jgi:ribosome-binding factor A
MSNRRTARVAAAIRQVVSKAILFEVRDPRVKNITVLHVEVPVDLRTAKVYISIMGDKKQEHLAMQGLQSARGWIQSRIADELDLRYTPVLTFVVDPGIKKSAEVSGLLRELQQTDSGLLTSGDEESAAPDDTEDEDEEQSPDDG